MSAFVMPINSWADAHRAIHTLQQTGCEHRIPLVQAVLDGKIGHLELQRAGYAGKLKRFLATVRKPALVLLGDDDDEASGPAGWPVAERVLRWSRVVVLHASGGHREHYESAVEATVLHRQVAMVECCTATLPAWMAAAQHWAPRAAILAVRVPPGQPAHPILAAAGLMQ